MRYEVMVGLRYTRARRRNRFISINSLVSMIGIAVGVWALIVVLSGMNGFQKEVRTRILGVASHVQISSADNRLANWQEIAKVAAQQPHVLATAPFVQPQAHGQARSAEAGRVRPRARRRSRAWTAGAAERQGGADRAAGTRHAGGR